MNARTKEGADAERDAVIAASLLGWNGVAVRLSMCLALNSLSPVCASYADRRESGALVT